MLQPSGATHREVMRRGVQGMVDEYRRYYGSWGFDQSRRAARDGSSS
jgi:hypothetical protein